MKKIILASVCIFCLSSNLFAYTESDFVWDFEWLENNNTIEIALNEPYQLKYRCSSNYDIVFTSDMADNWIHYDLNNGQRIVDPPTAYSISSSGVITGLKVGKYAMKFTGLIQPKSGADKWLYINIVSEKREVESNNTLDTANEFTKKIRFGLSNISDVDYFKCKHDASFGERVKFKLHYYGSNSNPFGYKWAAFSGTDKQQIAAGSLNSQDQECSVMITSGDYVYFEVYFNQSQSQYFNYGDEFILEFLGKDENVKATSITLDKSTLDIALGEQQSLTATILPENASDKSIRWSSSNEGVAKVADGVITALSVGTTTITASTNDASNLNAQCIVTVYDAKQKCGSNAYWSFDSATGLLSITGSGDMADYSYSSSAPWYKYRNDIISLSIGDQITSIGSYAFYNCSGLTSVTIPNSVTSIGTSAFSGCSGLTSVTIPNSVTSIGTSAFSGCSGLTSVTIGNSVTSIGSYAFSGCRNLASVTIPNSVTSIGEGAFNACSGLTSIKVHWKRPLSIDSYVWDGVDKQKCTLYVPEGTWVMYCAAPVWMDFVNIEEFSDEPGEEIYLTIMGVNGVILQQAVEMGETYKYLLDNKKNGKIVAVTFNGEDVTADVIDGKYTTPKITGNSEIYVEYDNQPLGDTNLDGKVNVNDITATAEIILLKAKAEIEAKAAMESIAEP